jgi:hypothetical protein
VTRFLLPALVLATLASGCMGDPTREILLPAKLKGAKLTADGQEPLEVKQGIAVKIPFGEGVQVIRVETPGRPALVERMRIFVNDPAAERAGENVIVAAIDTKALSRTIIAFPEDPITNLGHDFEMPREGEGLVLLSSVPDPVVKINGTQFKEPLVKKAAVYSHSYVTRGMAVRLKPGKHRVEFSKPGHRSWAGDVEVGPNEYHVVGVTLMKEAAPPATHPTPPVAPAPAAATGGGKT